MKILVHGQPLSGKTTLLRELEAKGQNIFQPDLFIAKAYEKDQPIYNALKEEFGSEIVDDHSVNKFALAQKVIQDRTLLGKLEELINPILKGASDSFDNVFIENSGAKFDDIDKTILVTADKEEIKKRYQKHLSHLDEETIDRLINK
jgi:dephospho-CoA kinase